ncbi:MAG: DNA-formamidopyrimidine glycosylase family protein [Actinomycetota bacterium]
MPELPEVEITARLLSEALAGVSVESVRVAGIATLKSFEPPIDSLVGRGIANIGRRGKQLIVTFEDDLHLLIHLMSAGRLQVYEKQAGFKDRTSRLVIGLDGGRELRLREFGTHQASWAKLVTGQDLRSELSHLGPEAWPDPPDFGPLFDSARPLHGSLRDQHLVAGIGRSWVDEILHAAKLSPFKRGESLSAEEAVVLRAQTIEILGGAIAHYEATLALPIPDKLPMPLKIHRQEGKACPRCEETIAAVHFESYIMCYCPQCQTEGKVLKDRRLSRLLK